MVPDAWARNWLAMEMLRPEITPKITNLIIGRFNPATLVTLAKFLFPENTHSQD
jgi:hypothetical protein